MNRDKKRALYESIMRKIAKTVKESIEDLEFNGTHLRYNKDTGKYVKLDQDGFVDNDSHSYYDDIEQDEDYEEYNEQNQESSWEDGDENRYQWVVYEEDYNGGLYIWTSNMLDDAETKFGDYFSYDNICFKTNDLQKAIDYVNNSAETSMNIDKVKPYLNYDVDAEDDLSCDLTTARKTNFLYYLCVNEYSGYVEIYNKNAIKRDDLDIGDVYFACNSYRTAVEYAFSQQDWDLIPKKRGGRRPTSDQGEMQMYWNRYFSLSYV